MSLNWTNLVTQGRAKDVGIPWSEKELDLMLEIAHKHNDHLSAIAPYIRKGISSVEEYEEALSGGDKPKTREDLEGEAKDAGVEFDPEATPDAVLEKETSSKKSKKSK
jgi:predicted DNA-binding protein YlxM (UPF0122 family)